MKGYQTETFVQTFPVLRLCTYTLCAEYSLLLTPDPEAETLQEAGEGEACAVSRRISVLEIRPYCLHTLDFFFFLFRDDKPLWHLGSLCWLCALNN